MDSIWVQNIMEPMKNKGAVEEQDSPPPPSLNCCNAFDVMEVATREHPHERQRNTTHIRTAVWSKIYPQLITTIRHTP
ncbi:unnamed protein product [Echinostoma caproni]|uniref:Uncharacterized protein n=1 Tax=Echinostoma caproni TaxID=27848 RepID=A0A183A9E8_9TREM|nr:unnamed protein product [Echinostoma caproni]